MVIEFEQSSTMTEGNQMQKFKFSRMSQLEYKCFETVCMDDGRGKIPPP